jgi:hypothetical protein
VTKIPARVTLKLAVACAVVASAGFVSNAGAQMPAEDVPKAVPVPELPMPPEDPPRRPKSKPLAEESSVERRIQRGRNEMPVEDPQGPIQPGPIAPAIDPGIRLPKSLDQAVPKGNLSR